MSTPSNRSVAVIGAGRTGVTAAIGLRDAGFEVTVYSDRDQRSLRGDIPATGSAVISAEAQQAEQELGLTSYLDPAPPATGMSAKLRLDSADDRSELLEFDAEFDGFAAAASTPG